MYPHPVSGNHFQQAGKVTSIISDVPARSCDFDLTSWVWMPRPASARSLSILN